MIISSGHNHRHIHHYHFYAKNPNNNSGHPFVLVGVTTTVIESYAPDPPIVTNAGIPPPPLTITTTASAHPIFPPPIASGFPCLHGFPPPPPIPSVVSTGIPSRHLLPPPDHHPSLKSIWKGNHEEQTSREAPSQMSLHLFDRSSTPSNIPSLLPTMSNRMLTTSEPEFPFPSRTQPCIL
ncbi:hypothetical protein O0I10_011787 [Lichtheimia ornata]|uniref:Uncharacterized protein n=1 Tax=Lichtheimia ornata TaxID=688661 RepID=A0AAD7XWF6_9FUNG|nr:uncharacterized protein O0I10_011787 [Lichtheimia ornata]KAJ8652582.1 hypothetical protein O0I10_011787 [Lichtheimia ornata]